MGSSSRRGGRRYRGGGKKSKSRVKLKIPPTIYEEDEEDELDMGSGAEDCACEKECEVVDLSILEKEDEVSRQRLAMYRKSKKKYIDWEDSDSDSSAKSNDSVMVHTCAQAKRAPATAMDSMRGRRGKMGNRRLPLAKVQTIERILDRIGSGSSFNSSEGPSDSSKHNMKVWENAYGGQERSKHKPRSKGIGLKLMIKSMFKI